jgi:lycopene beta-cyclase
LKIKPNTRVTTAFYRLVYKSKEPVFNPDQATFMDFRWNKRQYPFYVCATSTTEALLEYTSVFARPLAKEEYEREIEKYIQNSAFKISK